MRRIVSRMLCGIAAALCVSSAAMAAGINSEEQRVLDAVSQPFSYQGKSYVVNAGNIAEGKAKLAAEDVELTSADANDCISQFHQSYAELVEGGYCTESGGASDTDVQATSEPEHTKSEAARNKAFLKTVFGDPVKEASKKEKEEKEDKKAAVQKQSADSSTSSPDDWLEKAALGELLVFDEEDGRQAMQKRLTIQQGKKSYTVQADEVKSGKKLLIADCLSVWNALWIGLVVFSLFVIAGLLVYLFQAGGRHHRKKKKWRRVLACLAGISAAGWFCLLLCSFGLYFGAFSKSAVHRQLMESNYFAGVTQMIQEQAAEHLKENGYDTAIAEEVFSLSAMYIEEKQYIDAVLSGKKEEIPVERMRKRLKEKLGGKSKKADNALIQEMEKDYRSILDFSPGSAIKSNRDAWLPYFYRTVIVGICVLFLFSGLLFGCYGKLYTAVKGNAVGLLMASTCAAMLSGYAWIMHPELGIRTKPVFYQEFLQNYVRWDIQVMLYVSGIGLLLAVGILAWNHYTAKKWGER